ncbi:hypothetical protein [Leptolyngbya sp. FACHB-16]|uniref:hypothetical protein n=1 Tax=unclassified Leptolyngbya TaxID=2650499 RepID=UPI001683DEDF|nr:hypothetical protein [Leptolyngbya sp. FACHB-16]MBD2156025.1 hypothetical protein [Leptolyngbya sp. FACHB-16]
MAKFLLGKFDLNELSINKKPVAWSIDFTLPDEVRENMAAEDIRRVDGIFCMTFYSDPHVGDVIEYRGFLWQITGRHFLVNRYSKRGEPRAVPRLLVDYVGKVEAL